MNQGQRSLLDKYKKELEVMKNRITEIASEISSQKDDEQEKLDNLPENMTQGERADRFQEAIDGLEEVENNLDEAVTNLEGVIGG